MVTIERDRRTIRGVPVILHRRNYDPLGGCWWNVFCFRMPQERRKGWLSDMLCNLIHPAGRGGPGEFFAGSPVVLRRMGCVIVSQRCGFDI